MNNGDTPFPALANKGRDAALLLGMPTLLELPTLEANLSLCRELGLDFIELNMNLPEYQPEALDERALQKAMDGGTGFTLHIDENLNVCDFNPRVADAYLETMVISVRLAKRLGLPLLNLHMAQGVYFTLPGRKVYLFSQYRDVYLARMRFFRDTMEKEISGASVVLAIENTDGWSEAQREAIALLLESPVFALTLDIGHSHAVHDVDLPFFMDRENRLTHMHLHDARGLSNHLALGDGEIDLQERISLAQKHNASCVFETKTVEGLRRSVSYYQSHFM